jgi:hypothetical protein
MRRDNRRLAYGVVMWATAFVVGLGITWFTLPVGQANDFEAWRITVWAFLTTNGVTIDPQTAQLPLYATTAADTPSFSSGYAVPVLLVALASVLTARGVSKTEEFRRMLENASPVMFGYVAVGLIAVLESGASPAVAGGAAASICVLLGVYIWSTVFGDLIRRVPLVSITSFGSVLLLGLIFLTVDEAIVEAVIPMVVVGAAGTATGVTLLWGVRRAPD